MAFGTDEPILLCAPTSAGKTVLTILSFVYVLQTYLGVQGEKRKKQEIDGGLSIGGRAGRKDVALSTGRYACPSARCSVITVL
ncbi:hypothetical protein ARMSODRAFT_1019363 [Armillaria solidipes]|uniref:DEAD/DEAH box helicase domain-containing protein n=1 Tax=Armillaria solidipes TaxID=1076256 RepID=A0A2H3BD31_9AGAR|nr:hypothetical protein ARMSODRAFT_1019363 [Armillaria solidipes]